MGFLYSHINHEKTLQEDERKYSGSIMQIMQIIFEQNMIFGRETKYSNIFILVSKSWDNTAQKSD